MCSEGWSYDTSLIDGVCPKCGEDTVGGESVSGCLWSPVLCDECHDAPCDGSC